MKRLPCLLLIALSVAPRLHAQGTGASLSEAGLYSLYIKRHDMTVAFADLAVTRTSDSQVRKAAETLSRAHTEARDRLARIAADKHLTLSPPDRDTSAVLLQQARAKLEGTTGRSFDSTWVNLAHDWLIALILNNNRVVKAQIAPELQPVAVQHTTWVFHQLPDIDKALKKFK